jgi:hypothetical protein
LCCCLLMPVRGGLGAHTGHVSGVVIAGGTSRSQIIGPASRIQWSFKHDLPPPDDPAPKLEAAYEAMHRAQLGRPRLRS